MTDSPALSRVQRVRHELKRRDLTVLRVTDLSPHFKRITFGGESLADFHSASFDDHVKFMLDADGPAPVRRDYTPRSFDAAACELTIEFALHDNGAVTTWAAQAQPGQRVTVGGPKGSFIVPTDFAWHVLVGDETALPAIARRLEELPAGVMALVCIQVKDPADRRELRSAATVSVQWVDSAEALLAAARAMAIPAGDGYAWAAGEASTMASVRRVWVDEKGLDRRALRVAAYWKRGAAAHHENLAD
jgi:NADPH-dependent ferric siderophore reductase